MPESSAPDRGFVDLETHVGNGGRSSEAESLDRARRLQAMIVELDAGQTWPVVIQPRRDGQWALMHRARPGGDLRQRGVWRPQAWRSIVNWARFVAPFHMPNATTLVAARTGDETFEGGDA